VTRFSIRLNNDIGPDLWLELMTLAEDLGFDQIWVSHDLFWRSAPVLVAAAARQTRRIGLGIGVANPCSAHPAELAMHAATLQELAQGRFLLGLGAGADEFLGWAGITPAYGPVRRTREALLAIRALLEGKRPADVAGAGPGWRREAYLRTGEARTPIYLGGMGPAMLRLAGELADGALPLLFPPERLPAAREQIEAGARRSGRHPAGIDVAACVWCSVDADAERARRALAQKIAYYGASFSSDLLAAAGLSLSDFAPIQRAMSVEDPDRAASLVGPAMLSLGIAGDASEVADRCRWLVEAGARHISFGPPLGPDPAAALRQLGSIVLPALRSAAGERSG
jgi:5,10-methylenetetrahydromethanopterin reductase